LRDAPRHALLLFSHLEAGREWCAERTAKRSRILTDELGARGLPHYGTDDPAHASGIVTVALQRPEALYEHLRVHDIVGALRNRKVRFAPSYYTDETDLRTVLDAVDAFER